MGTRFVATQEAGAAADDEAMLRLSLTCAPLDASEALRIGLCDHRVTNAVLLESCRALAAHAAQNDPVAMDRIRALYAAASRLPLAEALAHERRFTPPPHGTPQARRRDGRGCLARRHPEMSIS